jgi:hypothetical protein
LLSFGIIRRARLENDVPNVPIEHSVGADTRVLIDPNAVATGHGIVVPPGRETLKHRQRSLSFENAGEYGGGDGY